MWNLRRIRPGAGGNAVAKARCVSPAVLAWVLAVVPTLVAAQESATDRESITLADAIARALERSPALAQSRSSLESAESGRLTAYGSFLPTVSAGSGASLQSQNRFDPNTQTTLTGSEDSYSASLSASYNVFSGGRKFHELSRAGAELDAASARFDDQRNQVVFQTKNLFFGALRQADLLEVARARVQRAGESLDMIRRQVQVGSATRSDTLRARLELANARQAVLRGENSLRAAEFALGRQIGVGEPVRAMPPEDLAPRPLELTMEEILQLAEDVSPLVRVARASASSASAEVKSARSVYLPNLNLSSGYGWNNDTAAFSGGRTSWNLRLSMSYPIFNGFSREASVQRASEAERVARLQETDARLLAREQADGALQALLTAEAAIGIANEAAAVAEEDLRIVNERYRVGVATILDLVTSQVALQEAEANLVAARYDYAVARADLQAILGREL